MERSLETGSPPERPPTAGHTTAFPTAWADVRALRATVELAPVGIAHLDRAGRFALVNDRMCAILDYRREALLGRSFQAVTLPEDLPRTLAALARLAAGDAPSAQHEKRCVRRDGSLVWTRVTFSAVRDAHGEVDFFIAIVEDISEQRAHEAAREDAEQRLHLALDASTTGTFRWDARRRELEGDEILARLFGLPPGVPCTADTLRERVHPDDLPRLLEAWWLCATEGVELDEEFRVVWPDGSVHWLRDRGRSLVLPDGTPLYVAGACSDVTARHAAEAEREQLLGRERTARAEAERASTLRDELLGIVAHDLRNPVHTIVMSASTMLEIPLPEEQRVRLLATIQRTARGMERLISDLLDVTHIRSGRFAIHPAPVRVDALIEEMLELFAPQARERGLTLGSAVAPGLPPVLGDHDRLVQVLANLLGNALKFTAAGGRITLHARSTGEVVQLAVEDSGSGIPAEYLPRVFDRFWQANRAARAGAGLGLAIAQGIVQAHGGTLWVDSAVGEGTTFTFTLPPAGS